MVPIDCIGGARDARTRSWFRDELTEDIVVRDDVAGNDPAVAIASEAARLRLSFKGRPHMTGQPHEGRW